MHWNHLRYAVSVRNLVSYAGPLITYQDAMGLRALLRTRLRLFNKGNLEPYLDKLT